MKYDYWQRHATELTCRCCGQVKPVSEFQKLKSGTYRHVCRRCKYQMYDRIYYEERRMREITASEWHTSSLVWH